MRWHNMTVIPCKKHIADGRSPCKYIAVVHRLPEHCGCAQPAKRAALPPWLTPFVLLETKPMHIIGTSKDTQAETHKRVLVHIVPRRWWWWWWWWGGASQHAHTRAHTLARARARTLARVGVWDCGATISQHSNGPCARARDACASACVHMRHMIEEMINHVRSIWSRHASEAWESCWCHGKWI
jgi:hypothetical protein